MPALVEHRNDILFDGRVIRLGRWRLPASHVRFAQLHESSRYFFVFPRTSLWIEHAGAPAFVADPNVVTYYNPGQEYRRRVISPDGDRSDYFGIEEGTLREIVQHWDQRSAQSASRLLAFTHGPSDAQLYWIQRAVYRRARRGETPDALYIEETMINVLTRLLTLAYAQRPATERCRHSEPLRELSNQVKELVARSLGADVKLADLARSCDVSVFHLCRTFRATTGRTIHDYRNELRLRKALERVMDRNSDLTGVALDLGYSSHSHFTAAFRRLYGFTPSYARQTL